MASLLLSASFLEKLGEKHDWKYCSSFNNFLPLIMANSISLILSGIILCYKLKYK